MRRFYLLCSLLSAVVIAGCGGGTTTVTQPATPTASAPSTAPPAVLAKAPAATRTALATPCPPPAGEGFMGVCAAKPVQVFRLGSISAVRSAVPGCKFPDVSSWQGNVDWGAVKRWQLAGHCTPAGIFKMGEFVVDPFAARNNAQLRALGMWRAGYWFLRNTGVSHEAAQIIAEAKALGLKIVVLDDEVPEDAGLDGPITAILKRAGLTVDEYASPGAYPGGSHTGNLAWIAAYGPSTPPPAPWGGKVVAFQCTDGVFGCVTDVPGIGRDDVSIDLGITKQGAVPVDPLAFLDKTVRHFGTDHASEYNTVKSYEGAKCRQPARRTVCKTSTFHLKLLDGRLWFVAHHKLEHGHWVALKHADWSGGRGKRFQRLWHDEHNQ